MSYHILEVQKVDGNGNPIPPSEFFVVSSKGKHIAGPFGDFLSANRKLKELEELEAENTRTQNPSLER